MPEAPRLPLRYLALSTILALAAAAATVSILRDDAPAASVDTIELTPDAGTASGDAAGVTFTTFEGDEIALSSFAGTPVLVNFFASACVPCATEMPALQAVYEQLGDRVLFLGLAEQDRPEDAQALVERTGVTYRTAQDTDGSVIAALGGTVPPTTVLLDADGKIVASRSVQLDEDGLRSFLADGLGITS